MRVLLLISLVLTGCGTSQPSAPPVSPTALPEWFDFELIDVQTGESFSMNDFAGKVVLLETMAMWCPTCLFQSDEMGELHEMLDHPDDLVLVSLDVDVNEDATSLKEYSQEYGFEWHFAIATLEVARALGNLYSAQYLNPPLAPMLIIDRIGEVHQLAYGRKTSEQLLQSLEPFLNP